MKIHIKLVILVVIIASFLMAISLLQTNSSSFQVLFFSDEEVQNTFYKAPAIPTYKVSKSSTPYHSEDMLVLSESSLFSPKQNLSRPETEFFSSYNGMVSSTNRSVPAVSSAPASGAVFFANRSQSNKTGKEAVATHQLKSGASINLTEEYIPPGDGTDGPPPPPLGTPVPEGFGMLILLAGLYFVICKNKNNVIEYSNSIQL